MASGAAGSAQSGGRGAHVKVGLSTAIGTAPAAQLGGAEGKTCVRSVSWAHLKWSRKSEIGKQVK